MQLGVDAAGVPHRKTITTVAEHPWQDSVDHCSNEEQQCSKEEEKKGGDRVVGWLYRDGGAGGRGD